MRKNVIQPQIRLNTARWDSIDIRDDIMWRPKGAISWLRRGEEGAKEMERGKEGELVPTEITESRHLRFSSTEWLHDNDLRFNQLVFSS